MNLSTEEKQILEVYKSGGLEAALPFREKGEHRQMFEAKLKVLSDFETTEPELLDNPFDAVPVLLDEGKDPKYINQYILRFYFPNASDEVRSNALVRISQRIKKPVRKPRGRKPAEAPDAPEGTISLKKESSVSYKDGVTTYEDEIPFDEIPTKNGMITPEDVMRYRNLDPRDWRVVNFRSSKYQGQKKGGGIVTMYATKLAVAPLVQRELTFADIDEFFENKEFKKRPKENIVPFKYDASKEHLEICIADVHCGLLSWRNETGSDFDLHICRERFLQGITDIVARAKKEKLKDIYLCSLGDILHIDNDENKTTKGTLQQADGRLAKIFDFAYDMMVEAIDKLLTLKKPVKYIYLCGNHDRTNGYMLAKCLKIKYENNPNVELDILPNPTKTISFGKVLLGLSHGDYPKKNKGIWMLSDARKLFANAEFVEEHSGHIHDEQALTVNGILVRSMTAQCGNSYWEHQQGYRSKRGIMSFIWNEDTGLRSTWYYNF